MDLYQKPEESLINSLFNISIAQIYVFILFVTALILFEGIFSLWVSLIWVDGIFILGKILLLILVFVLTSELTEGGSAANKDYA